MTIHAATLSTIRQQIARIPAGPGRSADEYVEDLRRTLDCMEVAETLETPKPQQVIQTAELSAEQLAHNMRWWSALSRQEVPAPNTIRTPTVPVTVDRNTKWCDERGYLSATAVALFTGLNAQIAELRKIIQREVG